MRISVWSSDVCSSDLLLAMVLLQAWPGLLSPAMHWVLAATSAVLWPLLHAGLQRMPAPEQLPEAMPNVEMGGADDEPPLEFAGDVPAMPYHAARRRRVERPPALLNPRPAPVRPSAETQRPH